MRSDAYSGFIHRYGQMKEQQTDLASELRTHGGGRGMREDKGSMRSAGRGSRDPGPGTPDSRVSPCTCLDTIPFWYN